MLMAPDRGQVNWFREWTDSHEFDPYVPQGFSCSVAILHPGTLIVARSQASPWGLAGRSSGEGEPSGEVRAARVDHWLLAFSDPGEPATIASYEAVPDVYTDYPLKLSAAVSKDPSYLLLGGRIDELVFGAWEALFTYEQPLNVVWPNSRDWCLVNDPDSPWIVLSARGSALVESVAGDPLLTTVSWSRGVGVVSSGRA
jgi:hypothetical protein